MGQRSLLIAATLAGASLACATPGHLPEQEAFRALWEYRTSSVPLSITVDEGGRPYLYVARKEAGLLILDRSDPGRPPLEAAEITKPQLGGLDAMYVVQRGPFLYVALGDFFDARGSAAGLAIVDVTDPRAPVVSSTWISDETLGGSSSVLVDGDLAYLAAMEEGVFLLDVSDKTAVRLVSSLQPDVDFPRVDPNPVQHPNARGLALRDGLLYVAYDAGGLRVVDVRDASHPKEIGRYVNAGMPAKQQAYNHVVLDWPYAYAGIDYCGMEVLDVRDPTRIRQVGWWNPWRCDAPSNLWFNSPGHVNQVVLDPGRSRVFLSAGDSELQVVDVSSPDRPRLAAKFGRVKDGQGAWGVTVGDGTVFLGYAVTFVPFRGTWAGIRALAPD